jgi:hypothetical protein
MVETGGRRHFGTICGFVWFQWALTQAVGWYPGLLRISCADGWRPPYRTPRRRGPLQRSRPQSWSPAQTMQLRPLPV